MKGKQQVFGALAGALENERVPWAVLHGYESLPADWANDLDVCVDWQAGVHGPESQDRTIAALRRGGFEPLLAFHSAVDELALYGGEPLVGEGLEARYTALDFTQDVLASTRVRTLRCADALKDLDRQDGTPVPSAKIRFSYLLAKRLEKGLSGEEQGAKLRSAYRQAGEDADAVVQRLTGSKAPALIAALADDGAAHGDANLAEALRRAQSAMYLRAIRAAPLDFLKLRVQDVGRYVDRIRNPSGLVVAVLGTDGSGKSTAIQACAERFRGGFHGIVRGHLRPTVLPDLRNLGRPRAWREAWRPWKPGSPSVAPHGGQASGALGSLARLAYYGADYLIGHPIRVTLPTVRNRLVLFDRYHADWRVDPRRWKLSLGYRWRRTMQALMPQPHLWLLIDTPASVGAQRTDELSPDEIARQRHAYRRFVLSRHNGRIVDGSKEASAVAASAYRAIYETQTGRSVRRVAVDPAGQRLPVLAYHAVGLAPSRRHGGKLRWEISPERLRQDLTELAASGFRGVSLQAHDPLGGRQVALTFDDGNSTDLTQVLPILREQGCSATFFPIVGKIGREGYLSVEGLRELADAGMEIGSHGTVHRPYSNLDAEAQVQDLAESKKRLEDWIGRPVDRFCFPGGDHNPHAVERVWDAGYRNACTTEWDHSFPGLHAFLVPRCPIVNGWSRVSAVDVAERRWGYRWRRRVRSCREGWRSLRREVEP